MTNEEQKKSPAWGQQCTDLYLEIAAAHERMGTSHEQLMEACCYILGQQVSHADDITRAGANIGVKIVSAAHHHNKTKHLHGEQK